MIDSLDIKGLLDEYGIPYRASGKNVSRGDLALESCPFCNATYHCCVNMYNPIFQCWVCGEKGFILKLLCEMEIFKGQKIGRIIQPFVRDDISGQPEALSNACVKSGVEKRDILHLPQGILPDLPEPHRNYLLGRGFDPDFLIKKYKLQAVYNVGEQKYRFRIIVPVFLNRKMVSFVAAATVRTDGVIKYLNSPSEESIVPVNHCLYNIDSVEDTAIIVEGVTDVWRMGDGFIASFRKAMTSEQISLLVRKRPKRTFVMYDSDAAKQSKLLAEKLCGLLSNVEVLELSEGDPGGLTIQEAQEIRGLIW